MNRSPVSTAVGRRLPAESLVRLERAWQHRYRIAWTVMALLAVFTLLRWWPGYVERVLEPGEMQALGGHSYVVYPLGLRENWLFMVPFDSNERPTASSLVVYEDGVPLPHPHSLHAVIAEQGGGAFSHWINSLYFSTSDNSDPRSNGRRYTVKAPLVPGRKVRALVVAALLLSVATVTRTTGGQAWAISVRTQGWSAGTSMEAARALRHLAFGLALVSLIAFAYSLLVDPVASLRSARTLVMRLVTMGIWAATGFVVVRLVQRGRSSWRLGLAVVVLLATGWMLFIRADAFLGGGLAPEPLPFFSWLGVGAAIAYVVPPSFRRHDSTGFLAAGSDRRRLALVVAIPVILAMPVTLTPVIEHWNASGWMDSHGYDVYAHNILSGKAPAGNSNYMPVYQYGMAAVYAVFGHFFFAQQLVNAALALLTVALLGLAAWNLFGNLWAALLMGLWVALTPQFTYAVFFTQIEAWYIPIVALSVFAWTCYVRAPSRRHVLLMAIAAGIGINTRNQGAFFFAWLCLAPLLITSISWRTRFAHVGLAVTVLALSLVPWSLRNYVVEGRFSPSAARTAYYLAILNDPRIGFYGVRYWEGWGEIVEDYQRRYPDPVERDRAMVRAGLSTPFTNFDWFRQAMFWRTLAFYGILPPGIMAPAGPQSTNWSTEWEGFVYWRPTPLVFLPLSLLGLLTRPGRTTLFLTGGIVASVAVTALTGGAEDRVSYPVLPLHMLMALAALFAVRSPQAGWDATRAVFALARSRTWAIAAVCLLVFVTVSYVRFGRPNLYAPLVEQGIAVSPDVSIDQSLPLLNDYAAAGAASPAPGPEHDGERVRLRIVAFNYQCPPKWGGRITYLPEFATDPAGATFYYASLLLTRGDRIDSVPIGVSWLGATVNEPLREGDEVEAEGTLLLAPPNNIVKYWVRLEKARKAQVRSTEIPPFF